MIKPRLLWSGLAAVSACILTGCMPSMTIEEMKAMMPERPVELDRLNVFAGTWEGTGDATMLGVDKVLKSSATSEGHWEGDDWYMVIRSVMDMDEFGGMKALETWTYDPHCEIYRSTWVDSMGSIGTGTTRFNENTNTWHMRAKSHGPMGKSTMKGWVRIIDDNNMEWVWSSHVFFGLIKTMEMKGTSTRK